MIHVRLHKENWTQNFKRLAERKLRANTRSLGRTMAGRQSWWLRQTGVTNRQAASDLRRRETRLSKTLNSNPRNEAQKGLS